jgi:phosphoglucomutase/phosphomannomutase
MKTDSLIDFDSLTQQNINSWLSGDYDEETKNTIKKLLKENPKEILDAFYTHLTFGTGGLRGVMGVGSNRMNRYTVGAATQGLANYINKQRSFSEGHSVIIGYDSRHHSREFAEEAATILASNDICVYIYKELRPLAMVSFGSRYKKCNAAIMITASHNPPEYNGYKVFWSDGSQVLPPHDMGIIQEVEKITSPSQVLKQKATKLNIQWIDTEIDDAYLATTDSLQNYRTDNLNHGNSVKVVYTSLHGTGITMVPEILNRWGFSQLFFVEDQVIPDGNFPTVHYPNPEESAALTLGKQRLFELEADLLIATDPDCDRIGVVVKHHKDLFTFTGNQIACLCLAHLCEAFSSQNRMPANAAFIKSLVTTELFQSICDSYHKPCFNVLPGFKYIAEKIREWEIQSNGLKFIFGAEESYGYLYGTHAGDKDAVIISALICEAALQAKKNYITLADKLFDLYRKHGYFHEKLLSLKFEESKRGRDQINQGIAKIQATPPEIIGGVKVKYIEDFHRSLKMDIATGQSESLPYPQTSMIIFWLEDGSKLVIRPSGTEPKIKIYCGIYHKNFTTYEAEYQVCEAKAHQWIDFLATYIRA